MDYKQVTENIRGNLRKYLITSELKSLVVGISGGIDSAVCVALAKPICDELKIPLIGRWISIETNKKDEHDRANAVGESFCTDYKEIDLTNVYKLQQTSFENLEGMEDDDTARKIRNGNLKARIRMMYLYNVAQLKSGMVLSTDNYTELMLSFFTLHGDVGDYGMIQNLWKTEVYELAKWIALNECDGTGSPCRNALISCIEAIPTDGLGITDSDLEQLGADSYDEVDKELQKYFDLISKNDFKAMSYMEKTPVIRRHVRTAFKRNNPYNIPRESLIWGQ